MKTVITGLLGVVVLLFSHTILAADVVPNEIRMPGTQPNEVGNFESPDKCDNCHAGYNNLDPGAEPATGWRGGAMGNAGRDPVFWATLAIAEQDFDGAGDLCIRCHSAGGWYGGRSTPTDGSGLAVADDDGIDCDTCHAMTNPDNSEHLGVMNPPFIANCSDDPIVPGGTCQSATEGYYGSGILSLWDGSDKLGPYNDAAARHQFMQSQFHRSVDFCGSCHDVSNSAVGDLAPNSGTQNGAPPVIASHNLGGPIADKAAFNNPPYAYGIVERTFSEYKASAFPTTRVGHFNENLPADLQVAGGSLEVTYQAAVMADDGSSDGIEGDYADGTPRFFSCQSCHMRPTTGAGCNKNGAPVRKDLPRHDHTGGNYWFASMAQYQDANNTLRLGGGLNGTQLLAMDLGQQRAVTHLQQAANLSIVNETTLKVTNLTGHKLITGYPEGRRMWLNIKWYDGSGTLLREDGKYGGIGVNVDDENGNPVEVESIVDLTGLNTKIYEAHYAVTRDWAATIQTLHGPDFALSYDRKTGAVQCTVSEFIDNAKSECSGDYHNTFHFALNNYVSMDNRIPPYGMSYDEAKRRNALPVPDHQYGTPGTGGTYQHWDEDIDLNVLKPAGAVSATIELLYQGTSWEYIQFLQLANNGQNAFLGQEGANMMDAWINADVANSNGQPIPGVMQVNGDYKMVPPVVMASIEWGTPPVCVPTEDPEESCADGIDNDCNGFADASDSNCAPVCIPDETPEVSCFDGNDNDCVNGTDCADASCSGATGGSTSSCGVGVCANTGDQICSGGSAVDNCSPLPATEPGTEITCNDGLDNDCDGDTDAGDADCGGGVVCETIGTKGACNDQSPTCEWQGSPRSGMCVTVGGGVCTDNDGDGWGSPGDASCRNGSQTDCNDSNAAVNPGAGEGPVGDATCSDGLDNNCDGNIDAADPACQVQADCSQIPDKNSCNAEATCRWDNRGKVCIAN